MTRKIVKIDNGLYDEIILDDEGRLIEQSCPVDEDGNIFECTQTFQYYYEDDKSYSRHRMWGQGCFWTEWQEE